LVGLFLAVLELMKSGRIAAEQDEAFGPICLVLLPPHNQSPPETSAAE
jgi:chromatin segregation and condensation protein Rec8/ScpA/Scc1 (kleisin family)